MKWLPNALTILRCILSFVVGWAILEMTFGQIAFDLQYKGVTSENERQIIEAMRADHTQLWIVVAFVSFVLGAILDFFDGWLARRWNVESKFGRLLDPIADKLLVGIPLIGYGLLALAETKATFAITVPAFAIVSRDISITMLRFSTIGGKATNVSQLAKWKTAIEFLAVAFPLGSIAITYDLSNMPFAFVPNETQILIWTILLYLAAALSLYTGYQYVRAAFSKPAL